MVIRRVRAGALLLFLLACASCGDDKVAFAVGDTSLDDGTSDTGRDTGRTDAGDEDTRSDAADAVVDHGNHGGDGDAAPDERDVPAPVDASDAPATTDAGADTPSTDAVPNAETDAGDATRSDAGLGDVDPDASTGDGAFPASGRMLVLAPARSAAAELGTLLAAIARAVGSDLAVDGVAYEESSLLLFFYAWEGRDARLAALEGYDTVLLVDGPHMAAAAPELHFEGVQAVAALVEAAGGRVALLSYTRDIFTADATAEAAYRVGNGVGAPVVPVSSVLSDAAYPTSFWAAAAAASVYAALSGRSAAVDAPDAVPPPLVAADWAYLCDAALARLAADASSVMYDAPPHGPVRIEALDPPSPYRFMIAGTSSEQGWRSAMRALLGREGLAHADNDLGGCNMYKRLDAACAATAASRLAAAPYAVLYARGYDVTAESLRDAGDSPDLQVTVYDRHFDGIGSDGVNAIGVMEDRMLFVREEAVATGAVWLPMHLMYARLKVAIPTAPLLSDGTHATTAVQTGLAAMSYVARTGRTPSTDGLDATSTRASAIGAVLVAQLSSLSRTGTYVPDDPATRPRLR